MSAVWPTLWVHDMSTVWPILWLHDMSAVCPILWVYDISAVWPILWVYDMSAVWPTLWVHDMSAVWPTLWVHDMSAVWPIPWVYDICPPRIDLARNGNSGCANETSGCAKCHFWWKSPWKLKNLGNFRMCKLHNCLCKTQVHRWLAKAMPPRGLFCGYMIYVRHVGVYIDGSAQDYSNSIANALDILQSCAKPSISCLSCDLC